MARSNDRLPRLGRALTGGDPRAYRDSLAALMIAGVTSLVAGVTLAVTTDTLQPDGCPTLGAPPLCDILRDACSGEYGTLEYDMLGRASWACLEACQYMLLDAIIIYFILCLK